jgi:hypothetical protein
MSHCFSHCGFRTGIVSRPSHFLIILHCVFLCFKISHVHTLVRRLLPSSPVVKLAARGTLAQPPLPPPLCWTPWNGAVPLLPLLLPHCSDKGPEHEGPDPRVPYPARQGEGARIIRQNALWGLSIIMKYDDTW